uniref:Uncharacterized protein n=1 Tax=Lepeophtheirus salmonis TaxID=72036 RepID=A0A0K2U1R7_LEPSM
MLLYKLDSYRYFLVFHKLICIIMIFLA